ncbi:putative ABC transporter related protein [Desulfamplus magnetovallimortis]|uniref:Putative ABC transporter related protein n=1 Tax=Desulfamplus magnetovallimortis TaxID=1246637 RepID=A0A1W1HFX2_9BACT|nr:ATP-binding cassette domain-containing protein [Desulfamplus magnetovallimortis]SLM31288.1 putative ABC transporter related protein [Desulfamplus magnetovallimortis]
MRELIQRLSRHPFITIELLLASFFANLLGLASSLYIIQLLNRYVSHGVDATLFTLTSGVCIAVIFEFAFRRVRSILAGSVGKERNYQMMLGIFSVLTKGRMKSLDTIPQRLRQEIMKGSNSVEDAYKPANINALFDLPFSFMFLGVLSYISILLGFITLCFMLLTVIIATFSKHLITPRIQQLTETSIKGNGLFSSANNSPDMIRLFDRGSFLLSKWRENSKDFLQQRNRMADSQDLLQGITRTVQSLLSISIYAAGAILAVKGNFNVGLLIGANILAMRAIAPINRVAQLGDAFTNASQSLERINRFASIETERDGGVALKNYQGSLKLNDVAFKYPGMKQPLFESLTLDISPGSVLVVTGENGTGKTTLTRLVSGLLEPDRGQILADGVDIRQLSLPWWRSCLTMVPQDIAFLPTSIKENLMAANPAIDDAAINRIINHSGLSSFIDQTSMGLDTQLTLNSEYLSTGYRKRLAIARALAVGGKLVIMDEPTEGLDPKGCNTIYSLLVALSQARYTMIIFSQDPNIIKGAGRILDLNSKPVPRIRTNKGTPAQANNGTLHENRTFHEKTTNLKRDNRVAAPNVNMVKKDEKTPAMKSHSLPKEKI